MRRAKRLDGAAGVALCGERDAEIRLDLRRARNRAQRDLEVTDGGVGLAFLEQRVSEVVLRVGKVGLQRECALVGRHRLRQASAGPQRRRQVAVGRRVAGAQRDRPHVVRDRLVHALLGLQRHAEVAFRDGAHRIGRHHAPVGEHRDGHNRGQRPQTARDGARAQHVRHGRQPRAGEQHQERHQRVAVAREDVEQHDARGVRERHRVDDPQPRPHRPGDDDAEQRERDEDAEVAERREQPQRPRPFGVRLLTLGVEHLGRVHEQHHLAPHQPQPRAGPRRHEVERLIGPVARHLRRRQRASKRAFREVGRVLTLVLGRAAPVAERLIRSVGARVVPDVQIRPGLRRGDVEAAADDVVADGDGRQNDGESCEEPGRARQPARARHQRPRQNDDDKDESILARQRQRAHRQSEPEERRGTQRPRRSQSQIFLCGLCGLRVDRRGNQPERQADEEDVEHRFLDQAVEENRRRVEGQHQAGGAADPSAALEPLRGEELRRRQAEQRARRRADDRLRHAHDQQMMAGGGVNRAEEIRIERRLVEHVVPDPVAGGDPARPVVVSARVAHQDREERRRAELPHVHEPYGERHGEDPGRVPRRSRGLDLGIDLDGDVFLSRQRWYASSRCSRSTTELVSTKYEV